MFAVEAAIEPDVAAMWFMDSFLGIALWRYIVASLVLLISYFCRYLFDAYISRRLSQIFSKSNLKYEAVVFDALSPPINATLLIIGLHLALMILRTGTQMSPDVARSLTTTVYVAFGLIAVWAVYRLVGSLADVLDEVAQRRSTVLDRQFIPLVKRGLRIVVLVLGLLTILSSLNVDVGSLVTGLGIGGAAMALGAQDSLGNVFGSVALLADRSIKVGDWIVVGDKIDGIVEAIGLRSTKIRTWPKTLLTIPNKMLSNEVIDNWSHMPKRRVKQTVGLEYCRPDQMQTVLQDIRQILREDHGVDQDFHMAHWTDFGDYSLNILIYYFTNATAWPDHLACRERINLKILECTLERGVGIAFPTRTILRPGEKPSSKDAQGEREEALV